MGVFRHLPVEHAMVHHGCGIHTSRWAQRGCECIEDLRRSPLRPTLAIFSMHSPSRDVTVDIWGCLALVEQLYFAHFIFL